MNQDETLEAAIRWLSPEVKKWSDDVRASVVDWLGPEFDRLGSEWGVQFRDLVGLPVADSSLWANQYIKVDDDVWAMVGIRFRGGDTAKPFVDVVATSLPPEPGWLAKLAPVLEKFAPFDPLCLRVYVPNPDLWVADGGSTDLSVEVDLYIVAGLTDDLRQRPNPPAMDDVALIPTHAASAAELAKRIYDDTAKDWPSLADWSPVSTAEELEDVEEQGLLFEIQVNGATAGAVAVEHADGCGISNGYLVREICLCPEFRRRGLGAATLRHVIEQLPKGSVFWGHIHGENTPSLRNALAVGRQIVGGHLWVTPSGYPGMPS